MDYREYRFRPDWHDIGDYWDTAGLLTADSDPKEAYLGYALADLEPDEFPFVLEDFERYIEHLKQQKEGAQ